MAITLRSRREIELMRRAGAIVADVLSQLQEFAEPGVTTAQLDSIALQMTADADKILEYILKSIKQN